MIRLPDVLDQMKQHDHRRRPVPFAVRFVTCDRRRRRGGQLVDMPAAVLASKAKPTRTSAAAPVGAALPTRAASVNRSLLFLDVVSGEKRRAHSRLIVRFNGEEVMW